MNTERSYDKSRVISAAGLAAVSSDSNLTADRIVALTGGHGMVNVSIHTVANVITEELLKGRELSIKFADQRRQSVDDIMEKAINVAKNSGADGANAALITAIIMYLAGSRAQVGIPAGNRKLGATARMLAKVDRSGVSAIPTAKMNNKISAFPAVMAIYEAMKEGKLTSIDGRNVPEHVSGGPLYGHSALGEDYVWPEMAENGARIGTQAMLDAMAGAAIRPHAFTAAVLGAASILEIIHPDAEVPEGEGKYGRTTSAYLAGQSAAKTAGLPEKLHVRVTGEEYDTAQVVGDVGLILKDIGAPSVIGMMAFDEIFALFEEAISGFSGLPFNPPLGHVGGYAIIAMKTLLDNEGDVEKSAKLVEEDRSINSFNPEVSLFSLNVISRKSDEVYTGPITKLLIKATDPARAHSIYKKASFAYDQLAAGKTLEEVVRSLDDERVAITEKHAAAYFERVLGTKVKVDVRRVEPGARRTIKVAKKYLAFDPSIDLTITVGENSADFDNFVHELLPRIAKGEAQDVAWAAPLAGAVGGELTLGGCMIFNLVVPAAVAAAMEFYTPEEAGEIAEKAAYITGAIPGGKLTATHVGKLALEIVSLE